HITMKKLLIAAFSVAAVAANAQILYQQGDVTAGDNIGTELGVLSNEFTDFPTSSTYCFDNITNAVVWTVTQVWVEGITNDPVAPVGMFHLRFSQNANFTTPGNIGLNFSTANAGTLAGDKDLIFDLGAGIALAPGTWWVSAWVVTSFGTSGQWNWKTTETINPPEAIAHNPGGGALGTTEPINLSQAPGIPGPRDLVFRISGTAVPEPGTFIAIGIGLAGLAIARRRK
ncbi:MAG: PEP-CTERM sorting domain-containing protein, partial [Fimbriimonadales bacterium]